MIVKVKRLPTKAHHQIITSYTTLGWRILPVHGIRDGACTCGKGDCTSPVKHPATAQGVKDATNDVAEFRQAWKTDYNVGLACGDSFVVVDVDGLEGFVTLAKLERENRPLPETVTARTGKGRHYYFKTPTVKLENKRVFDGIDIKTTGGYILAPPSDHANGKRYTWIKSPYQTDIAQMPLWLLSAILNKSKEIVEYTLNTDEAAIAAIRDDVYIEDEAGRNYRWTGRDFVPPIPEERMSCKWKVLK